MSGGLGVFPMTVCQPPLHTTQFISSVHLAVPTFMSNILVLNCWVLGDGPNHIFTVKIEHTETVSILRKAIKDEKKPLTIFPLTVLIYGR